MENSAPLVTIFCLTYNHRPYIEEAFRGFLKQKTSFPFEVFVFDDASTDGTSDIVRDYCAKYPEIFRAEIMEQNTYRSPDRIDIIEDAYKNRMRGKYLASCEGDDYWINENKLEMQVTFMEKNPDVIMTAHASLKVNTDTGEEIEYRPFFGNRDLEMESILIPAVGIPSTASTIVRRECMIRQLSKETPNYIREGGDISHMLYALLQGRMYYFDCVMSAYRVCVPGGWTDRMEKNADYSIGQHL